MSKKISRRSKKVVKLGVTREKDWLYFLRGNEVWRLPFKVRQYTDENGRACFDWTRGRQELITTAVFVRKPEHLYYLDKDGDISCVDRRLPRHTRQQLMFE